MSDLRTAAQQALEALDAYSWEQVDAARTALRAALAEPVQECPNCASLQDQNTELDQKLAELQAAVLRSNGVDL